MSEIKISIEIRIDAGSESAARQYATAHGIDVTRSEWCPNDSGKDGRLYAAATAPFSSSHFPPRNHRNEVMRAVASRPNGCQTCETS